jgi:hypothetical protein
VGTETAIAAAATETFSLATTDIPANAAGVALNLTAVPGAAPGYLTSYPTSAATPPVASDVNWTASESPAVPNFTIADTAGTGLAQNVDVANSYFTTGAPVDVIADAFGYFAPSTAGAATMESAAVTDTTIAITYNEPVTCPSTASNVPVDFTYDWTGTASGIITGTPTCSSAGDVLTLTGTFALPAAIGGGSITYTAPPDQTTPHANSALLSVWASGTSPALYEATQKITVAAATTLPVMVSAYTNTTAKTLVITYNEDVSCSTITAAGLALDFTYDYTGQATGLAGALSCASIPGTDYLTLTAATSVTAPSTGASVTYTAPPGQTTSVANSTLLSVYATGSSPALYEATGTITTFTAPSIYGATVTPGASGTGTIAVTYTDANGVAVPMTCPTDANTQLDFEYSNGGAAAYPSHCVVGGVGFTNVLTLSTFYNAPTGTTAATLVAPGASDTLTYTAPTATNTTTNSVSDATEFPQFAATQPFALGAAPAMVSAVVIGASMTITYNEPVTCIAGSGAQFAYDYETGFSGGTVGNCSSSGDVLTVLLTGTVPPTSTASIVYTQGADPVSATLTGQDAGSPQTLPGTAIS